MAFVTKEAAFACNYFYGKPGIFAFLLRNPIEVQNNLVKASKPGTSDPEFEKGTVMPEVLKAYACFKINLNPYKHIEQLA